ncbi:hypothetical protein D3C72_1917310 [compost metagenome]
MQRFFRVDACRNVVRIAHRQTPVFQQAGPVSLFVDGELALRAGFWRDHHQAVTQQGFAGGRIDRFFLHRVIHPFLIGRNKQIRRRTGFDLASQR